MSIRIESMGLAQTRIYVSIQQGSSVAAETGLEQTRVVRSSSFLLDWFGGAESTGSAGVHMIGASEESQDTKSTRKA
jgi:hypothetical protein